MASKSPNMFLAFQITDPDLIKNLRNAHFNCVVKDHRLKDFINPLETAHVTLGVFRVEIDRLEEAKKVIKEAFEANLEEMKPEGMISFKGLGMFGRTVLFAKPNTGIDYLNRVNGIFKAALAAHDFDVMDKSYNPHITLFQVKGASQNELKEIPRECFQDMEDQEFGSQKVEEIQFLSMYKKKDESGYYYCEDSYKV
eukprot:GFUD01034991.1.p1 GENE.GFUD01034991.1~~GFUD01034991.1.p1  ORF type:complete len:197 (+),score=52.68 GFUD01034991.1:54-644(+)